jgi:hypothetical protein
MEPWMQLFGVGFSLAGALVIGFADAWLSRSMLIYLDALEANLEKMVASVRSGRTQVLVTGIDVKRDQGQNQARLVKTFGWLLLTLGFGFQFAGLYLTRPAS